MTRTARSNLEKHVSADTPLIEPGEHAHDGLSIPEIMMAYGDIKGGIRSRLPVMWTMFKGLFHIRRGYSSLRKNPYPGKTSIDAPFLGQLQEYALSLGCVHVGYTQVPRNMIFSNQKLLFDKAIVVTLEMDKDSMSKAPKGDAGKEVWRTYERLGHYVNLLADMMRKEGYAAHAGSPMGGDVNYPLLAQKAGLGYIGKHGLLITPETGPSLRIAAVYTNIENLPYTDSDKHAWIDSFCQTCHRCVKKCPGQAIYPQDIVFEDGSRQCIDYAKCAVPFSKYLGCSVCIKECTFFKEAYAKIERAFLRRTL